VCGAWFTLNPNTHPRHNCRSALAVGRAIGHSVRVLRFGLMIGFASMMLLSSCGSSSHVGVGPTSTTTSAARPDFAAYSRYLAATAKPGTAPLTERLMPEVYTATYLASICTAPPAGSAQRPTASTLDAGALATLDFLCGVEVARRAIQLASGSDQQKHAALIADLEEMEKYRHP
jgi:hypothetical protein